MRNEARIVTSISKTLRSSQKVSIPKGDCEFDDGAHGTGPYTVYWKKNDQVCSCELTLSEFVTYVDIKTQSQTFMRGGKNAQPRSLR